MGRTVYLPTLTIKINHFMARYIYNRPMDPIGIFIYPFKRPCLSRWIFREFPRGGKCNYPFPEAQVMHACHHGPWPFVVSLFNELRSNALRLDLGEVTVGTGGKCVWRIIPRTWKWLVTIVSFCPLRIGLWDPFQMPFPWLRNGQKHLKKTILSLEFFG